MEVDLDGHPGLLVRPPGARALYVVAHGAGAGMRHVFMAAIAEVLATRQIATLRWEFPYMARGQGRPDRPAVAEAAVHAVWAAARAHAGGLPMFAGGKSFGGRMTTRAHAAQPLADVRGLVLLGFPLHPSGTPAKADERAEHLPRAAGPLLFLTGDRDALAELPRLRPVVEALGRRAQLHVVAHADHGFDVLKRSGRVAADVMAEVGDVIAGWMVRNAERSGARPIAAKPRRR